MKPYLCIPALTLSLSGMAQQQTESPNIIIVYADDLGYGDIGINGHPDIKTPNLDRMGIDGMRFTNYYSASPASTASRYSLLTGRYPIRSGFRWVLSADAERGIHPDELTLAEALKKQGYATAIFGKWHLGSTRKAYLPLQNGFDEYVGFPYSNDMLPPKYPDIPLMDGNDTLELNPDQSQLTALYTKKALSFIERHRKEKFFLYLPYAMPHVPLHPGKNFAGKSKRGAYGDAVEELDWGVGEILKALKTHGLHENTVVWFMSDNGPWLTQRERGGSAGLFRDGKGSTWEGGVRVPCLVQWPAHIRPEVNEKTVNAMDVYATCIRLAGGDIPDDRTVDGQSIVSYLTGENGGEDKEAVPFFYYGINNQLMAVRKGMWKLHVKTYSQLGIDYFDGKQVLLFNLYTDPSEKYDLSDSRPDLVAELSQLIKNQREEALREGSFFDRENPK
ncbi:MAG: sulfatase [Culturomica sp.]|nr:sulfatase [Culturomica sp.]